MTTDTRTDMLRRGRDWIDAFSWKRFLEDNDKVLESLPDLDGADLTTDTALAMEFFSRHSEHLLETSGVRADPEEPVYDHRFYERQRDRSRKSANQVVPYLMELVSPRRVVDVGCGVGIWLAAFLENGVEHVVGIDGPWVKELEVLIPQELMVYKDLSQPIDLDDRFDLSVSVEVAEHLPNCSAESFVELLCRLAPIVCFSAAIPVQGGVHHINEQWPQYWIDHFGCKGYRCLDCLRQRFWNNENVEAFYAQNMFLFCSEEAIASNVELQKRYRRQQEIGMRVSACIHPRTYFASILRALLTGVSIGDMQR